MSAERRDIARAIAPLVKRWGLRVRGSTESFYVTVTNRAGEEVVSLPCAHAVEVVELCELIERGAK